MFGCSASVRILNWGRVTHYFNTNQVRCKLPQRAQASGLPVMFGAGDDRHNIGARPP